MSSSSDEDFFVRKRLRAVVAVESEGSSESGSDGDETDGASSASEVQPPAKRVKTRSPSARRLSITPPPGPSALQLQAAVALVRSSLPPPRASPEPSDDESVPDRTLELDDPELARLYRGKNAKAVRVRAKEAERRRKESKPSSSEFEIVSKPKPRGDVIDLASSSPPPEEERQEQNAARLTLHLVSADGTSHPVQVLSTTRIATIIAAHPSSGIRLRLDGELLAPDSTVADAELEHDDQLEVVQ